MQNFTLNAKCTLVKLCLLGKKVMSVNVKQYFARHAAYLSPAAAHGTHRVWRMFEAAQANSHYVISE